MTFLVERHAVDAVRKFAVYIREKVPGGMLDIGMDAANAQVCEALEQEGFHLLDQSVNHTLFFQAYQPQPMPNGVSLITVADEDDFRKLHNDPDAY